MTPILNGLRIIAVEQYGAGPFGTQFLADLGAEVIKIEHGDGDVSRSVGPHFSPDTSDDRASLFFQSFNRNKKSLGLDLSRAAGRDVLRRLAPASDALLCNLRGDVPARLGLDYASLKDANPRIVCAHLSGFGRDGSRAAWPGYDYLMQAEAGYFAMTGDPAGPPARMGLSIVDMMAGTMTAAGLLAGVLGARQSGAGGDIDVSLYDVAMFHLSYIGAWQLAADTNPRREARSAHPSLVPCQLYATADGWLYLMCNKEKFWRKLCEQIGRSEWLRDPRFNDFPNRLRHRDLLTGLIDEALAAHATSHWLATLGGSVPCAPVLDVAAALANPLVAERGLVREAVGGDGARFRLLANPVRTAAMPAGDRAAPGLGEHTDRLLAEAGYSPQAIAALRSEGVVS